VNTKYTFNDADEVQIPITDRDRNVLNSLFFNIHTVHLEIIEVFYSPTNAQVIFLKNNIKIYNK